MGASPTPTPPDPWNWNWLNFRWKFDDSHYSQAWIEVHTCTVACHCNYELVFMLRVTWPVGPGAQKQPHILICCSHLIHSVWYSSEASGVVRWIGATCCESVPVLRKFAFFAIFNSVPKQTGKSCRAELLTDGLECSSEIHFVIRMQYVSKLDYKLEPKLASLIKVNSMKSFPPYVGEGYAPPKI